MRFRVNDAPICRDFLSGRTGGAARAPVSCLRSGSAAGCKPASLPPNRSVNTREECWEKCGQVVFFLGGGSPNASVYRARPEVSRVHSLKTRIDADLEPFCEPTVNSEDKPGNCCRVNDHYTAYKPAQAAAAGAPRIQKSARELFLSLFTSGLRRLGRRFLLRQCLLCFTARLTTSSLAGCNWCLVN